MFLSASKRIAFCLSPKFDNTLKPGCSGMLTHLKRSIPDLRQHKIHLQPLTSHDYLAKQSKYSVRSEHPEVDWPDVDCFTSKSSPMPNFATSLARILKRMYDYHFI